MKRVEELIHLKLDGEITNIQQQELDGLLQSDVEANELFQLLSSVDMMLTEEELLEAPQGFTKRVMHSIQRQFSYPTSFLAKVFAGLIVVCSLLYSLIILNYLPELTDNISTNHLLASMALLFILLGLEMYLTNRERKDVNFNA